MNVLVLGGGGREHALAESLGRSRGVVSLVVAPGNAGIETCAETRRIDIESPTAVLDCARHMAAGLVVIGPEAPLAAGVSDRLREEGVRVVGPSRAAARLETSKAFAREVCDAAGAPSASWACFESVDAACRHLAKAEFPVVVKADGLAAGKGVTVAATRAEAEDAVRAVLAGRFGDAGRRVLIESFLCGEEASFFALCDGRYAVPLTGAEDYKRAFDGDMAPNTGGMGARWQTALLEVVGEGRVMERIVLPCLREMSERGTPYRGVLYVGLMLQDGHPHVVEFNARFGDPECQAVLARLQTDLFDLLLPLADGDIRHVQPQWTPGAALTVVMAAPGYPESPEMSGVIRMTGEAASMPGIRLHHAGTRRQGECLRPAGGRVLNVTGVGRSVAEARERAYAAVATVDWPEGRWRNDIGWRSLRREETTAGQGENPER